MAAGDSGFHIGMVASHRVHAPREHGREPAAALSASWEPLALRAPGATWVAFVIHLPAPLEQRTRASSQEDVLSFHEQLQHVAIHEAGHAYVAERLGIAVYRARAVPMRAAPFLTAGDLGVHPVELVDGVIEVKSTASSRTVAEAVENIASVKRLGPL